MLKQSNSNEEELIPVIRAKQYIERVERTSNKIGWVGFTMGVIITSLIFLFILIPYAVEHG